MLRIAPRSLPRTALNHSNSLTRRKPRVTFQRDYSVCEHSRQSAKKVTLVWLNAGKANLARAVELYASDPSSVTDFQNRKIIVISSYRGKPEPIHSEGVNFFALPNLDLKVSSIKEEYISLLTENFSKGIDSFSQTLENLDDLHLIFLNAIGGVHLNKGETLESKNKIPALYFAEAVHRYLEDKKFKSNSTLVHLSSISATLLQNDEYGRVKRETDEELIKEGAFNNINQILCFRVGYVVQSLIKGALTKNVHDFSPEQLAKWFCYLPVVVYRGRECMIQPVHANDLARAVIRAADVQQKNVREIIDVVGEKSYTQSEFFKFFTDIFKKTFIKNEIDYEDFKSIAETFSHGHIAPYAVKYIALLKTHLNEQPFKRLVGRNLTPLEDIHSEIQDKKRNPQNVSPHASNPLFRFSWVVLKKLAKNPSLSIKPFFLLISIALRGCNKSLKEKFKFKNIFVNVKDKF